MVPTLRPFFGTLSCAACLVSLAQLPPVIEWQHCYGGTGSEQFKDVHQTTDGGYIALGRASLSNGDVTGHHGGSDIWVVRTDALGALVWQRCLGGSFNEEGYRVREIDSGFVVVGYTESEDGDVTGHHGDPTTSDAWVVKLSTAGVIEWQRCLGGTGFDTGVDIVAMADGGLLVTGSRSSFEMDGDFASCNEQIWVVLMSADGDIDRLDCWGGTDEEISRSIQATPDGGYVVAGTSRSTDGDATTNHGEQDVWVVKVDALGSLQWQHSLGGPGYDVPASVDLGGTGYVVIGRTTVVGGDVNGFHGWEDTWLVRLEASGDTTWTRCYGETGIENGNDVFADQDGSFTMVSFTNSNVGSLTGCNHDVWVLSTNATGDPQWQLCLGGSGSDTGLGIDPTVDGGCIVSGQTTSNDGDVSGNHGSGDAWLVKLSTPLGIGDNANRGTVRVFPMPAEEIIWVDQPARGSAKLTVFNSSGSVVLEHVLSGDGPQAVGLAGLLSGAYYYRVTGARVMASGLLLKL